MKRVLHLLRASGEAPPAGAVADGETAVVLDDTPAEEVLRLLLEHDLAVVWGGEALRRHVPLGG